VYSIFFSHEEAAGRAEEISCGRRSKKLSSYIARFSDLL
jgi:hypothetical protein